jgi:hypothetical protein
MPTEQQKYIGDHGKALGMCYQQLASEGLKSFQGGKFVPMKKTGKGAGKRLYDCVQEMMGKK